jgi:polyferredoxin
MSKPKKTLTTGQYVTLAVTFFLMCVLRVPVTLFLLFAFALGMTLVTGRKTYCARYCPLGTVQDHFFPVKRPGAGGDRLRTVRMLRLPLFLVFWGYLIYVTLASFPSGDALWESVLLLMLASAATAFLLQALLRKRTWCSQVCPFGRVLDGAVGIRHIRPRSRTAGGTSAAGASSRSGQ